MAKAGNVPPMGKASMLLLSLLALSSIALTACGGTEKAEPVEFTITDAQAAELAATAAAFQVQSVAAKEDSGTPIDPPLPLPQFSLTDQGGDSFGSDDLAGKTVLLSFAYTRCPDVCPALFGHFIQVQREMESRIGDDLELVIISVDPERDTPEWLNQRTTDMGGRWHFLTGSRAELEGVWADFGVRVEKQGEFVGHTGVTYLVATEGAMTVRYPAYATFEHFIRGIESTTTG